jgi:hypothetical protein
MESSTPRHRAQAAESIPSGTAAPEGDTGGSARCGQPLSRHESKNLKSLRLTKVTWFVASLCSQGAGVTGTFKRDA